MIRLDKLQMHEFRGVRDLTLEFNGKNAAIMGANGTGKSSVVDAVDFLLTGDIRHLKGEGTGGLKLSEHGPHVDALPDSGWVEGVFMNSTDGSTTVLRRTIDKPQDAVVDCDPPATLLEFMSIAKHSGAHLLTRREILKFIFTEPRKRGEQVASLLQITQLDDLRKQLQGASRDAAQSLSNCGAAKQHQEESLLRCFDPPVTDLAAAVERVNANRSALGAPNIETWSDGLNLIEGVEPPASAQAHPLHDNRVRTDLSRLMRWFRVEASDILRAASDYRQRVAELRRSPDKLRAVAVADLVNRGVALLEGDYCPLCLAEWEKDELGRLLETRAQESDKAKSELSSLRSEQSALLGAFARISAAATSVRTNLQRHSDLHSEEVGLLVTALKETPPILLPDPVDGELPSDDSTTEAEGSLLSKSARDQVDCLEAIAGGLQDLGPAEKAWVELNTAARAVKELAALKEECDLLEKTAGQLGIAARIFVKARDHVLKNTYDQIVSTFKELYAEVHHDDEATFDATFDPTDAGLKLEVDFYGRGKFPPAALHSEGHQDSMGVLLFLALAQYLGNGPPPLVLLDDVMSTVDKGHRRATAEMFKTRFPDTQLIITTHDRVWWKQLIALGLATRKNAFEFKGWTVEGGPTLMLNAGDMLEEAKAALGEGNVPRAAHSLRRALEAYLPDICDALGAQVRFRSDGDWHAGDFIPAVKSRYTKLFKLARSSAQSWGGKGTDWSELDDRRKAVFTTFDRENWAVNPAVHFNEWADFAVADFEPVLNAYESFFSLFVCDNPDCGGYLRVVEEGNQSTAVRCDCGKTNWNLVEKRN